MPNYLNALLIAKTKNARARITTRSVQRWVESLCLEAGIPKRSPHSFRHSKAHRILEQGGGVADIARILGHSEKNPVAAFNYLKLNQAEQTDRAQRFM